MTMSRRRARIGNASAFYGVASCTRTDPQAKGLGAYLRAIHTDIPDKLTGTR